MVFSRRSLLIFSGRVLAFLGIAAFFWAPMIFFYRVRAELWGGDWWLRIDWLLVGVFFFMTTVSVFTVDIRRDLVIILIAAVGGLCIEGWGTQTNLWHYYTRERPPLWIIPAWATSTFTVDSLVRMMAPRLVRVVPERVFRGAALVLFVLFLVLMVLFVRPFFRYPTTIAAFAVVTFVILSVFKGTCDRRIAVLFFVSGSMLGWFLELWGTTRHCWIYYTRETPPFFAVLSHGLASATFWRAHLIVDEVIRRFFPSYQGHWSRALFGEPRSGHTPR